MVVNNGDSEMCFVNVGEVQVPLKGEFPCLRVDEDGGEYIFPMPGHIFFGVIFKRFVVFY
jgi:hypothetical protein